MGRHYTIDGRHRSKSLYTHAEAERDRGLLLQAVQAGGRFDETAGEPKSWQTPLRDVRVHEWSLSRRWACGTACACICTPRLPPDSEIGRYAALEKWMAKNCLTLGDLDRERVADIDRRLGLKLDASPMAANTANRIGIVARVCSISGRGWRDSSGRVATSIEDASTTKGSPVPSGASTHARCRARPPWLRRSMQSSHNSPGARRTE